LRHRLFSTGFTLVEIAIAIATLAVLATIAIPAYERYRERALIMQAVNDIGAMGVAIGRFLEDKRELAGSLDEMGVGGRLDPWGRPYQYQNLTTEKGKGAARKDRRLNPLNSDFDLYSVGKDGQTKLPLPPKVSHDDIIRARNGRFIGIAKDFDP
jgi:general secretion pathway protein G